MKAFKRYHLKTVSFLLSFVMLLSLMPQGVIALDATETPQTGLESTVTLPDEQETVLPSDDELIEITELTELREENVKHFDIGNGYYKAISYGSPVHRKDESGVWQNIDNRLFSSGTSFATSDGRTTVADKYQSNKAVLTLSENGYIISMVPVIPKASQITESEITSATVENHTEIATLNKTSATMDSAARISSDTKVTYQNAYSGVDIEYVITGNDVKENIIVKSRQSEYVYVYMLGLQDLTPTLESDGSISLKDSETNEVQYVIPRPYMYDQNGDVSYDVAYELQAAGGKYLLKIEADKAWINSDDRAFPVTIDPTVTQSPYEDTYINSSSPSSNYGSSTTLWVSSSRTTYIESLTPQLPDYAVISQAYLTVCYYYYEGVSSGYLNIGVYECNNPWNESSLTWNSANHYSNGGLSSSSTAVEPATVTPNATADHPGTINFDVTALFKEWYLGNEDYGVGLKYDGGTKSSVILYSSESSSANSPYWSVTYYINSNPVIENGIYFLQNGRALLYADTYYDGDEMFTDPITIQELNGEETQRWEIEYIVDGYYEIRSYYDNRLLTVPIGEEDNDNIDLEMWNKFTSHTGHIDNQLWKITLTSHGLYKIKARSSEGYADDLVLDLESSSGAVGLNVAQREYLDNTSYYDEWNLMKIGAISDVECEGQQESLWCWVTTARMFAKHYYPEITYTQTQAVVHVKEANINETGSKEEAQNAIDYYISNISGAYIDTVIKEWAVYSEEVLLQYLDDGHVIYASLGYYQEYSSGFFIRNGGHAILIVGYVYINDDIRYIIQNSAPEDEGSTELISYEKLYNGRNSQNGETANNYSWDGSIVVNTWYSGNTIPCEY